MVNGVERRGEVVVEQQEAGDARRARAGSSPPTRATATTTTRNSEDVAGQRQLPAQAASAATVEQRQPEHAASSEAGEPPARGRGRRPVRGRRRPGGACSWVTMCTSIGPGLAGGGHPDAAGDSMLANRPRRLAPSTSWVALTPRAKSSSAAGCRRRRPGGRCRRGSRPACRCRARCAGSAPARPSAAGDVDGEQVGALGAGGDAGGPADQGVALGAAGQRDDDPLPRLPGAGDAVVGAVAVELLVDPVGQPQQGQLAQRGQVADPEVVGRARRRPSPAGRCCRAPSGGAAPRASCRPARSGRRGAPPRRARSPAARTPVICSTTSLSDSRCWMLTVEITSIPASSSSSTSCQRLAFREPGHVGVGQLVDQRHLRVAGEHRVHVHLGEGRRPGRSPSCGARPPARPAAPRCAAGRGSPRTPTTTSVPRSGPAVRLVEHRVGLAHAGRGAEVDPQLPAVCHH